MRYVCVCVFFSVPKISQLDLYLFHLVPRHNDLFRYNLLHNESTAWIIPFLDVSCDMRCNYNCWSKYWSDGWRLVWCNGKYFAAIIESIQFHFKKIWKKNRFWFYLSSVSFLSKEWYILSADNYHTDDDVCWIWCHIAWLTQLYEMG